MEWLRFSGLLHDLSKGIVRVAKLLHLLDVQSDLATRYKFSDSRLHRPGVRQRGREHHVLHSTETVQEQDDYDRHYQRPVDPEVATIHRFAELPLNHLGFAVDYCDVDGEKLPAAGTMDKYHGVISWFGDEKMRKPARYLR